MGGKPAQLPCVPRMARSLPKIEPLSGIYKTNIAKIPFLRGLVMLWDSLGLGMLALTNSANLQSGEDEKLEGPALYLTLGLTFLVAIAIFFLIPAGVGWLTEHFLHWNAWWSNLVEGILRLFMLVGYIWAIGFMPDIARVFAYHGAEHKTINAYEAGADTDAGFRCEIPACPRPLRDGFPADPDGAFAVFLYHPWPALAGMAAHQPGFDDPGSGGYCL